MIWGIIFIIIGLVLGVNALGIAKIDIFFDGWWTLFIIIPCLVGLFKDKEKTGSIIGILIGVVLLLSARGILDFEIAWKLALPTILILIGLSIILKNTINKKDFETIKKLNNDSKEEVCATFTTQTIEYDDEKFKGTNLTAVFGAIKCDLRKAIIKKDIVINATTTFGGIEIYIPENVNIKIKSTSIFGGVDEKKKNKVEEGPTIYINANCLFGGVDIK